MRRRHVLKSVGIGVGTAAGILSSTGTQPVAEASTNQIEISDIDDLQAMEDDLTADYVLVDDIDASETEDWNDGKGFDPIGDEDFSFLGSFDGQGYEIKNLYLNRPDHPYGHGVGLFGNIHEDSTIKNVGIMSVKITGDWAGGLVGHNEGGVIENSYSTGELNGVSRVGGLIGVNRGSISNSYSEANVEGDFYQIGGLTGFNNGSIHDSYSMGNVSGEEWVGGLVGWQRGDINSSHATGTVTGNERIGGLVGYADWGTTNQSYAIGNVNGQERIGGLAGYINFGTVNDSYSLNDVSGETSVGGFVGYVDDGASVLNSYSIGRVTGEEHIGGLIGWSTGEVEDSFWDINTSGTDESAAGTGTTTEKMTDIDIYEDADWDIEITDEDDPTDGYPFLSWELDSSPVWYIYGELFDITINVEGAGTTDPEPGTYTHAKGEEVSLTASPDTGWEFVGWGGDIENENQEIEIAVEEDVEIIAEFERQEYELSIEVEGEGTTNPEAGQHTYEFGEEVEIEATPQEGWRFVGWSGDVQSNEASMSVTIEEDAEIIAEFERQEFEMEISVEGEGTTDPEEGQYTHEFGEEVSIIATPDNGWEFSGWAGDIEEEDREIELTIEGDTEVIADFERKEYELTIEIDGEGSTSITEGVYTFEFEEEVELEATPESGWEFVGWTGDVESKETLITVAIEEDMEVIANFSQEETPTPTPTPTEPTPTPTPTPPDSTPTPTPGDPTPTPTPTDDDDSIPGPGIVGTVASLAGAGYVLKWWSDKQDNEHD